MLGIVGAGQPGVLNFIRAFRHHVVVILGGGGAVVLLGLGERFFGYSLPRWAYGLFVAALAVLASYRAWKDERARTNELETRLTACQRTLEDSQRKPANPLPLLTVEIDEAILSPVLHNGLKCFVRVTVHNSVEGAPCIVERTSLAVRIGENWYTSRASIDAGTVELATYEQLYDTSEVPMNTPYHLEDELPVIEVGREDAPSLFAQIGEDHPLRRGFPKAGWLGFLFRELPTWPTKTERIGEVFTEIDRETGEESYVDETRIIRTTRTVEEISLTITDGHGTSHSAKKVRPFGTWSRRIEARRERELKMY